MIASAPIDTRFLGNRFTSQEPMVSIPRSFAEKIDRLGPHFCLAAPRGKDPSVGGKGWQLPENLMYSSDPRLLKHLAGGGNYGVVAHGHLIIIDTDGEDAKQAVLQGLPQTLTVKSPGSGGFHFYFLCGDLKRKYVLVDGDGENVGHVQGDGKMCIGPGSVHPNGGVYEVVWDLPIMRVTDEQIRQALGKLIRGTERSEEAAEKEKRDLTAQGVGDLNIGELIDLAGMRRMGDEYYGPHPVHGSKTGRNFWVNPVKNVWHCFRCGSGGGPLLWLAVEEGIIDCSEAGPGALHGELFKQVLDKAIRRGLVKCEPLRPRPQPIILSNLNMIEDPSLAGKPVIVEAMVSSTSISYLVPMELKAIYRSKDGSERTIKKRIDPDDPLNIQLVGVDESIKYGRLRRFLGLVDAKVVVEAYRTVYRVLGRPPVFSLEKHEGKVVDEQGFEYKPFDIYVTSDHPMTFQPSSLIRVEGIPLPNPKTQQTTLLAYRIEFPEEAYSYNIEAIKALKSFFESLTISQRLEWILDNFERFSQIVGRRNLAEAGFLAYFTPTRIRLNGAVSRRGWANVLLCGDTTTAKTETIRQLIRLLKGGMLVTAETASAVGLTGTATQVERGSWFVDWGLLVLMDRKLLAVDGAHKLSLSNWAALAEAERSGLVSIVKAAKNTAYARTRQIKIANPVNSEAERYSTKSLGDFLYACQALPTILDKTSIARLDLTVFSDQRDLGAEEINKARSGGYDPLLENLSEALKWCWSGSVDIAFTDEAIDAIHTNAAALYDDFFYEEIPLVSIDMKWKLARLSAALAFLTLSTEDFRTITVTKEHVGIIVQFFRDEYSKAGLNILAQTARQEILTIEDVDSILGRIEVNTRGAVDKETICAILKYLVLRGRATREELKANFGLKEIAQLRPLLAAFTSEGLIKSGRGFYPEPKLIQAYKVSEGFNLSSLSTLSRSEKKTPPDPDLHEREVESSFSDLDNLDKSGENSAFMGLEDKQHTNRCVALPSSTALPNITSTTNCENNKPGKLGGRLHMAKANQGTRGDPPRGVSVPSE